MFNYFILLVVIPIFCIFPGENASMNTGQMQQLSKAVTENMVITYHRNDVQYFFNVDQAEDNYSNRDRFDLNGENETYTIQSKESALYLWVDIYGLLTTSLTPVTKFDVVPLQNSTDFDSKKFHLYVDNEPLVTIFYRPPFSFSKQSIYPDESPAVFSFSKYKIDIEEYYHSNGNDMLKVAQFIRSFNNIDIDEAYAELVQLITNEENVAGYPIFELAQYIYQDTEGYNKAFRLLPQVVRAVASSQQTTVRFVTSSSSMTMKNHFASSNHYPPISTYTFSHRFDPNDNPKLLTAITYGGNRQLYMYNQEVTSVNTGSKYFNFRFKLDTNLTFFTLDYYSNGNWYNNLRGRGVSQNGWWDYYFSTGGSVPGVGLSAVHYELDIVKLYDRKRENILPTVKIIQNSLVLNQTEAFTELVRLMKAYNHFEGKEVFIVAQIILEVDESILNSLPIIVQNITRGGTKTLKYVASKILNYSMKYHWASDLHENIRPYVITYSKNSQRFAVTYGEDYQWVVINSDLTNRKTSAKDYSFELFLNKDLENVHFHCQGNPLVALSQTPDIYFKCNTTVMSGALFSANDTTIDVPYSLI